MDKDKVVLKEKDATAKETKDKKQWQEPKLEDVSGKIMAQPYIRFT